MTTEAPDKVIPTQTFLQLRLIQVKRKLLFAHHRRDWKRLNELQQDYLRILNMIHAEESRVAS